MSDDTGGSRGLRRAGALAVMAAVAVLAAACGGSASSPASSASAESANLRQEIAYSQCMRAHGVPDFPDPNASGAITVPRTTPSGAGGSVSSSQMDSANDACQHLLPSGGGASPGQVQQEQTEALKFAQCMRTHGVSNYPDPTVTSQGYSSNLKNSGINTQSPQFLAAVGACRYLLPAGVAAP
jgi:hypothetical protein